LSDYSSAVRDDEKQLIEQAKQEIRDGHTVFSGLIRDNQGRVRCAQDESISDAVLTQLDWFVEGVRIYE
jgi:basic membrane protein A